LAFVLCYLREKDIADNDRFYLIRQTIIHIQDFKTYNHLLHIIELTKYLTKL